MKKYFWILRFVLAIFCEFVIGQETLIILNANELPLNFTSPNYPNKYPLDSEYRWIVTAPEGRLIVFTFLAGDIESCCDHVELTEHDDVFAQFTGVNLAGQSIISSSNNVTVTLFSDDSIALNGFVISYHTATCGENFVASDDLQTFSTPNWPESYPDNQDCYWIIKSDEEKPFDVTVNDGETRTNFDFVEIFEGLTRVNKQSGEIEQFTVETFRTVRVHFSSENSSDFAGFNVSFQNSVCGGNLIAGSQPQTFSTPFYPRLYSNGLSCEWNISASATGEFIILVFLFGRTEDCCDHVEVHYDEDNDASLSGQFDARIFAQSNAMFRVTFESDATVNDRGFRASVEAVPCVIELIVEDSPLTLNFTNAERNCTWIIKGNQGKQIQLQIESSNLSPSQSIEVFDNAESSGKLLDEIRNEVFISTYGSLRLYFRVEGDSNVEAFHAVALENCGRNIVISPSQTMNITSPGWPMSAPNNLDCTWYVETNQYREVLLQIAEVETQPCCDQLRVRIDNDEDREVTNGDVSTKNFTGSRLRITFKTDNSLISHRGFRFVGRQAPCGSQLLATENAQEFTSLGWPVAYPNDTECEWVISGSGIMLVLHNVDLEPCCDYVEIFSGNMSLGRFNQTHENLRFSSKSSEDFRVKFFSDESVTRRGFNATYFRRMISSRDGDLIEEPSSTGSSDPTEESDSTGNRDPTEESDSTGNRNLAEEPDSTGVNRNMLHPPSTTSPSMMTVHYIIIGVVSVLILLLIIAFVAIRISPRVRARVQRTFGFTPGYVVR